MDLKPLIIALDTVDIKKIDRLLNISKEYVDIFKIGPVAYTKYGNRIIELINSVRKKVFLDLKFHDIPSVVKKAVENLLDYDIFMLSLHISGGEDMLKEVSESVKEKKNRPLLIGITLLTTLDQKDLNSFGVKSTIQNQVRKLALIAKKSGLDGVVCSANEVEIVRKACGKDFIIITPGLSEEHKRRLIKQSNITQNFVVVGRYILDSKNPVLAIKRVYEKLGFKFIKERESHS